MLLGKDATRAGILKAIREELIQKATRKEDVAILYFAGHGFQDASDTYLAGADAKLSELPETAISGVVLADAWKKVLAGRKVFLVDACHSGGVEGVRGIGGVVRAPVAGDAPGKESDATSLTIAATGASELSTEDPKLGQGVFTIALLRGLRGEADANKDGKVTGDELASFLKNEVPSLAARAGGKQTPAVTATGGATIWLSR
ncbi:caspase family protein [bacterium]|nr:caspase family protein [bacterium]